jgi:hypothetical protein
MRPQHNYALGVWYRFGLYVFVLISWLQQPVTPGKHRTPLPTGSTYEAQLAGETPYTASELLLAERRNGFKFRTLLGKFMQLTNWTRLDLLTATARVAQYQSAPGPIHFEALHRMVLFLRCHIDDGLTYGRRIPLLVKNPHETGPSVASMSLVSTPEAVMELMTTTTPSLGDPIAISHEPMAVLPDMYDYMYVEIGYFLPLLFSLGCVPSFVRGLCSRASEEPSYQLLVLSRALEILPYRLA